MYYLYSAIRSFSANPNDAPPNTSDQPLSYAAHRRACHIPGIGTDVGPRRLSSLISDVRRRGLPNSATENLLCILKGCRNIIAAQLRFRAVRIAERSTRPAPLVVKHEP